MTNTSEAKIFPKKVKFILLFNFIALILTFVLNFMGHPSLKYVYVFHLTIAFTSIMFYEVSDILPIILTIFFLEGQGRILWEYASWSRIAFDILMLLAVLKIFIKQKKIFDFKRTPPILILFISLHFLWYLVEFSNLYSVSTFAVLGAAKLYVYPMLFFFGFSQLNIDVFDKRFQKTITFFILLLVLELALSIYQFNMKESLVLKLSGYYHKAMSDGIFTGLLYRPFGTTQLPGAISAFIFLTAGLLFFKVQSKILVILRIAVIAASAYVLILCQVRSALIKYVMIILLIHFGEMVYYRFKLKGFLNLLPIILLFLAGLHFLNSFTQKSGVDLNYVKDRISSLADVNKVRGARLNTEEFFKIVSTKLSDNPMGLGPGLTGAAGSLSKDLLIDNPFVNSGMTWTSDNIIIALIIDFGYGAIFYLLMICFIPFFFMRHLVIYFRAKNENGFRTILICFSSILTILVGNWGAIGLTYNPESFVFWLFSAIGFSTIANLKTTGDFYSNKHDAYVPHT